MNALTETQFAFVNNDIVATIKAIFDMSKIISDCELELSSGLYFLRISVCRCLRWQSVARDTRTKFWKEWQSQERRTLSSHKEFQRMMALVNCALRRESMVNKQPLNWVSDDTLRRITGELGNVSETLPDNLSSLLGRLVDASIQVDKYHEGT